MAVLFADIAGSTKLYELLGDTQAKFMIDEALASLRAITERYKGRVVKTIGDELMCVFVNAERGFLAAADMQNSVDSMPVVNGARRMIRIGFHAGPVIEEKGDVFGDTVNVAARMAGLAKGMQIMTTRTTVDALPSELRASTRPIASVAVMGKADDMAVCEVLWQESDDLTMAAGALQVADARVELVVRHAGKDIVLDAERPSVMLGRDQGCDCVISDPKASRQHARIEKRRDKFFLTDQSTNGTYVSFAGEPEIALRREEVMLRRSGRIGFGHSAADPAGDTVEFTLRH
ncbi:MAG: adenylate/guanylate cyclase domain-containing protein [Betaproteobacteria bacterium]|nr:adenylate/guanylate cyclase domain-containing protein [Betaproteobacteria bacterium]